MDDPSDDSATPPPARRTSKAAPPFIAPRARESGPVKVPEVPAEAATEAPPTSSPRRSTPLFVPPTLPPEDEIPRVTAEVRGMSERQARSDELADLIRKTTAERIVPATPPAPAAAVPPPEAPAPPINVLATARETKSFVLENLEQSEITLNVSGDRPAVGGSEIQVIEYGGANSGLQSSASEGERPRLDGVELEATELSLQPSDHPTPADDLQIESFWAAEAFTPTVRPTGAIARESISREIVSRETPRALPPVVRDPPADGPPRKSALDALRVEEVMPLRMPTPPSVRVVTPHATRGSTPGTAQRPIVAAVVARTPASLEALKELEPWALPAPANSVTAVADALERVARRIRSGEVRVRSDLTVPTEENALSAALQALNRASHH